jgi:cytochrome c-type biogenesis protein CcmH
MRRLALILALLLPVSGPLLWPVTGHAVTPGEVLADPVLEARAREISRLLRCPVCQGETIDESNADIAADLRVLVRERLVAGDTDRQVIDYIVARYGEFVLFLPEARGVNLILWVAGPAMLLLGIGVAVVAARRRRTSPPEALSADEQARLDQILRG